MTTERQTQLKTKDSERSQRVPDTADATAAQSVPATPLSPSAAPPEVPNPTALQLRRANVTQLQRSLGNTRVARKLAQREDAAPAPAAPSPAAAPAASGLIVDDAATDIQPGQMTKSAFLAQLRGSVEATVTAELGDSPLLGQARAQIEQQFAQYSGLAGPALEQTIKREVPDAAGATSAQAYIAPICARVRTTIAEQRAALPPGAEAVAGVASGIADAASSVADAASSVVSSIGSIFFKAREGGAQAPDDPRAVQAQLGTGHALDNRVQSGLESALGQNFAGVRVHSDARAGALSNQMNARAFTVGQDIAFGSGEYQPGTLIGDALIAHEVAHVAQQSGATPAAVQQKGESGYDALEADADQSAVGAVAAMWGGLKGGMAKIGQNALPQLKSGLRLQKCAGPARTMPTPATPTPASGGATAPGTPAAAVPRQDYAFIMGQDEPGADRDHQFYKAARIYFGNLVGGGMIEAHSLAEIFQLLRQFKQSGQMKGAVGNLYIVSHALADGQLMFGLDAGDKDGRTTLPELQTALQKSPDMFKLPEGMIDEKTSVQIKGCNIGRSKDFTNALDQAFGGKDVVTAPTHKQEYKYSADGKSATEGLAVFFVEHPGSKEISSSEQLQRFKAKYKAYVSEAKIEQLFKQNKIDIRHSGEKQGLGFVIGKRVTQAEIDAKKAEIELLSARPEAYAWRTKTIKGKGTAMLFERTEYRIDVTMTDDNKNPLGQNQNDSTFYNKSTYTP